VTLVCHYFPPHTGGIEQVVYNEAKHLAEAGHTVTVLTSAVGEAPGTRLHEDGFTVHRCPAWNGLEEPFGIPFPVFGPSLLWSSLRLVRSSDVVHVHDSFYMTTWIATLWSLLLRRPLIVTQHVEFVAHPSRTVRTIQLLIYRTTGRAVFAVARRICVVNSRVADVLKRLGVDAEKIITLPNGVDIELFSPGSDGEKSRLRLDLGLPTDRCVALFVGRFVHKKGFDRLMGATSRHYVLALAGGEQPAGFAPTNEMVFLGNLTPDHLSRAYQASDMFVLPSEAEGFPLTVQEAMSSGLPVITTDDPGYDIYRLDRSLVRLITPSSDGVRSALEELAGDRELRGRMSEYSIRYAQEHFRWNAHVDRLTAVYTEAAG
jgi:D-inositol-3-phosphate glycosyltransferase